MVGAVDGVTFCRRRRGQRDATRGRTWLRMGECVGCCCRVTSRCYEGSGQGQVLAIARPVRPAGSRSPGTWKNGGSTAEGRVHASPSWGSETCGDDSHPFSRFIIRRQLQHRAPHLSWTRPTKMANSKFEYVKHFEQPDQLLPNTWVVVRLDGRGFTKFSAKHGFEKPNDRRALDLMNAAARGVVTELPDITIAYGVSDEYSFVFHKTCSLFERRSSKLVSTVVSTFTAYYVHLWSTYFPDSPLSPPLPSFDGRAVCYPSVQNLRDYLSWRQVDCHINNLYNTTFWALIQLGGMDATEAEKSLKGTYSADKHEILFSRFSVNYNNEPEILRKGSVIFRDYELVEPDSTQNIMLEVEKLAEPVQQSKTQAEKDKKKRAKAPIVVQHLDIIKDDFWDRRPWLLSNKPGKVPKET